MKKDYKIAALCISEVQKDDVQNMIYPLNQYLNEHGWKLIVYSTCTDLYERSKFDRGEASVFHLLNFDYLDAVILFPRKIYDRSALQRIIRDAQARKRPVLMIESDREWPGTISLDFDEETAFRNLVTHLIREHRFTRLHCIAGFRGNDVSENRIRIFKDVLAEYAIPFDEEKQLGYGDFYDTPTVAVMEKWRAAGNLPEAIVCINDTMAATVCAYLREHGIRVPEDIVVTGFDGSIQEQYTYPRLSTCRRDMDQLAEYICHILNKAEESGGQQESYVFPYVFTPAGSCGCSSSSVEDIGRSFHFLYGILENENNYSRSLNNMTAWLLEQHEESDIHKTIQKYIPLDSCFCLNADFHQEVPASHPDGQPFTEQMDAVLYSRTTKELPEVRFATAELIPNWDSFLQGGGPLFVMAVHNQNEIYGYVAALAESSSYQEFSFGINRLHRFLMSINNCISMHAQHKSLKYSNQKLKDIQNTILISFADLVESRDMFTGQHIKRTSAYIKVLVDRLQEDEEYRELLTERMRELLCKAAPLHDIGKIKISDIVLNKAGKLTDEEFERIKQHTVEGSKIINTTLTNIEDSDYLRIAHDMALYHHEKWDGSGYPCHLAGEDIPLCARIMAVVDVFDALTSKRVYKDAFPTDKAFSIMKECSGTQFDQRILSAFVDIRPQIEELLRQNQDAG